MDEFSNFSLNIYFTSNLRFAIADYNSCEILHFGKVKYPDKTLAYYENCTDSIALGSLFNQSLLCVD